MQIPIEGPQIPDKLDVEAEILQGDASLRRDNGIQLCIVWSDGAEERDERGFKLFLCQSCLKPMLDKKTWHDKRCMFEQLQDILHGKK